jgi:hypothetical protein
MPSSYIFLFPRNKRTTLTTRLTIVFSPNLLLECLLCCLVTISSSERYVAKNKTMRTVTVTDGRKETAGYVNILFRNFVDIVKNEASRIQKSHF